MKRKQVLRLITSQFILLNSLSVSISYAQEWTGGGTSDSVSDTGNWNPAAVPANDGTADLAFDGITRTNPLFDSPWDVRSLTFASGAGSFSLGGSAITLGGAPGSLSDVRLSSQSSTGQSIGNSILIARDQTWNSTAGGNLTLTNQVDLAGRALRLDFGTGTVALQDAGRISSATPANLQLASGTLLLNGRHDTGIASSTVDRIGSNIIVQLNGGNLTLVSDDNSGQPASAFTETLGTVSVSGTSKLSVISSANHLASAGALLSLGSLSLAESSHLNTFVDGSGNRLHLGSSVSVGSGRALGISTANGGVVSAGFGGINVQQGGQLNFVRDAFGTFGSLNSNVSVAGIADFDSSAGANTFQINGNLSFSSPATVRMTLGDTGSDRVNVSGNLVLDGTLELTENATSSLTGSGLHKIFTYGGSLTNNRMQLAGGADFSGNPNWKFAITTAYAGEVNLVASEVRTWDGQGTNGLFSNATNWNSDKALASFDHLVFDPAANSSITNDLVPGVAFGGIELGGTNNANVVLSGSQAYLSSGIVVHGGNHTINLDLTPNALDFESDTIHVNGGSATFNGNVAMLPGLNLKMEVADGSSVTFNGNVSGSKLFKTGTTLSGGQSTVTLTGVGTFDGASGGSSVTQGDLVLAGANGSLVLSGNPQLDLKGLPDSRSRLVLDNSATANGNRLSDNSLIAMFGNSSIKFIGNATTGVTENLTGLALFDGVTTFEFDAPAGVASGMVFQSFPVGGQRTSLNYLAVSDTSGALGTGGANPFLKFNSGIADGALIGRGSYNGTDFLRYDSVNGLRAATTRTTTVGATAADNLRLDTNESLNSPLTIRSLALNGATLSGTGALTVSSGMILGTTGSNLAVNTNARGGGISLVDTRGDTTVSATLSSGPILEKWGSGNLIIAPTGQIVMDYAWPGSSLVIQEGSLTIERDNAIVSNVLGYRPNLELRNGTTLDVGSHLLSLGTVKIDQGGQVLGTGTLSASELVAGNIPNIPSSSGGGSVMIASNLKLSRLIESTNSAGLTITGKTTFDTPYSNSVIAVRNQMDFQGEVDFGKRSLLELGGSGNKSVTFGGTATAQELTISTYGGGSSTLGVAFNNTLAASALFITADNSADIRFNDVVTFAPTQDITSPVFQLNRGSATLGGANGSLVGLDNVNLGVTTGNFYMFRNATNLVLDNSLFANNDRIDDSAAVNIAAGSTLTLSGNSSANVTEVLGTVNLGAGNTTFDIRNDPARATTLQLGQLNRTADNVMLVNSSGGILGASGNNPRLLIDNASAGFLERTIINGTSFAGYSLANGVGAVATVPSVNGALTTDHVSLASSETVVAPTSFQSLVVGSGASLGGADLQISSGHMLLQNGSSVSNIIETPGDAFVYSNGNTSLNGSVVLGGDFRKTGPGSLSVQSLVFNPGATVFLDSGTLSTAANNAISSGTHMNMRAATFNLGHNVSLGNVSLSGGADIIGAGTLSATSLTVDNSPSGIFSTDLSSTISTSISGATNVAFVGGNNQLHGASTHTGTTSIDNGTLVLGSTQGAILSSSVIEIGKNSPKSYSTLNIASGSVDRIGNSTDIEFHNNSQIYLSNYGSVTERVGDVTVHDKAKVYLSTYVDSTAVLHMNSFTSTGGVTTLSSGNFGNFRADAVTIDGVTINNGQIVPTMFRNNSPVEWISGNLKAVTPLVWTSSQPAPTSSFVTVTSAFSLATNTNVNFIRFESTDPFNSTPGTTLFVQSGLFFSAPGGNTMNANVSIGANGSVSTSSTARFTEQLTASGDLKVIGGGATIIDGSATVTGLTSVKEGKLVVGGTSNSTATFNGDIDVSGGAALGGSGMITGDLHVLSGGITQPGNSPGTLTITGNLTYDAQSIAEFELAQIGSSDKIVVTGDIMFNGQMDLRLFALSGITTGTYTLFDYDGTLTGFANLSIDDEVGLGANLGFDALLINNLANKTIDLQINSLGAVVVPEPSSLLMAILASGTFVFRRRRAS